MIKAAALLVALMLVLPSPASVAQTRLANYDCGGAPNAIWACTDGTFPAFAIVGSVVAPRLTSLIGAESIVDLGFVGPEVPAWWRIGAGMCRPASRLQVDHASTYGGMSCVDHFGAFGAHATTTWSYVVGPAVVPGDEFGPIPAYRSRLYINTVIDSVVAATAGAPAEYDEVLLFVIRMTRTETASAGTCPGCTQGSCMTFLRTRLRQPAGLGDRVTGSADYSYLYLQGGVAPCYYVIPDAAARSTWGQVKTLYR